MNILISYVQEIRYETKHQQFHNIACSFIRMYEAGKSECLLVVQHRLGTIFNELFIW